MNSKGSFKTILETIGNTPLVELQRYSPNPNIKILAKLEGNNPTGSVKDRIALYMMKDAIEQNVLDPHKKILEATSGNTGIGLAMISAILGYKFTAVMPESVSAERRILLKAYGAEIILTDGKGGTNYAVEVANNLAQEFPEKYVPLNQFVNSKNVFAHYETTGPEIINEAPDITHFVAGMGTGGTLMGVGKKLKEFNDTIKIVGVEPKPGSIIQGLRNMNAYIPPIYNEHSLDSKLTMDDDSIALELARDVLKNEGISVGMSSGAALWGVMEVCKTIKSGVIVTLFPDRADKYLNTLLFK